MATVSASYTTSARRRLESANANLDTDCKALAFELLSYSQQIIGEYAAFRALISGDACNRKYKNVVEFTADASTGTCSINLKQLWKSRGRLAGEQSVKEYIAERTQAFEPSAVLAYFTRNYLSATADEFECDTTPDEATKSGKSTPSQAQATDDGDSKSGKSKSGSGKEEPKRKRQPGTGTGK